MLAPLVAQNISIFGVLRDLGLRQAGGTHSLLSRRIAEYGLDSSHFLGRAANRGPNHKGPIKISWTEVLVKRETGRRQTAVRLRRALLEMGRPYLCAICPTGDIWAGKPLMLQVDHKNRDRLDDQPENLQFLCPNCHSQQEGWCNSKGYSEITSDAKGARERRKIRLSGGKVDTSVLGAEAERREGSNPSSATKEPKRCEVCSKPIRARATLCRCVG
jgi:5-methylcytosine-specific restriction endonuclease McrA